VSSRRASPEGEAASLRKDSGTSFDPSEGPPFRRVLVANRGEIALRIIRACHELGVEVIAVYSDADASAAHVRAADAAVRLGPAPAAESYLRGDVIIDAARRLGAEAIHPGYGFLAERAAFARAVEEVGLVFVGPTSASIAALGDKLAARRLARAAGVPVVPGTLEPAAVDRADAVEAILADADGIGFPLFVKASSGGGGRGMRRVTARDELPAALAAGSAEALAAFGDGAVYLEREVRPARHVEVQLLGDAVGTIVAVGERDCSIQRRHQKLVEESPAPGLSERERRELHDFAVRVARAAELRNAATAEFLLDEDRRFWFLEVNTRIQVEHGVTELTSGIDLVREQLLIAAGRPLSNATLDAAERAAAPGRHAIEVRLSAEDPARSFAPVAGRVGRWSMPDGPGVRVDTAIEAGDRVPPDYDSLVAKVLVVDVDRGAAIGRLARVLDEVEVTGIQTTLPFHRFVVAHPGFRAAELSTDWVAEQWDPAVEGDRGAALEIAAWVAVAVAAGGDAGGTSGKGGGSGTRAGPETRPPSPDGMERRNGSSGWLRAAREEGVDRWPEG
jgi:acetyl/propionyl-CoA carboxylase alpha subunit